MDTTAAVLIAVFCQFLFADCTKKNDNAYNQPLKTTNSVFLYPDSAYSFFRNIVDSVNTAWQDNKISPSLYSRYQAIAGYIEMDSDVDDALADIKKGVPYLNIVNKYRSAIFTSNDSDFITKIPAGEFEGFESPTASYSGVKYRSAYYPAYTVQTNNKAEHLTGKWIYQVRSEPYSDKVLTAFYIIKEWQPQPIPLKYLKAIDYEDKLLDSTTTILYPDALSSGEWCNNHSPSYRVINFIKYIHRVLNLNDYDIWNRNNGFLYVTIEQNVLYKVDMLSKKAPEFMPQLNGAIDDVLNNRGYSTDEFECYVARYAGKEIALKLKRKRIVHNSCVGHAAILHYFEIARLAAETFNWKVFIKAHLACMGYIDFERIYFPTGFVMPSSAKELERIHVDIITLFMSDILQLRDFRKKHLDNDAHRLSYALAKTSFKDEAENRMLEAIADKSLDINNRLKFYSFFYAYNKSLEDTARKSENDIKLQQAAAGLQLKQRWDGDY